MSQPLPHPSERLAHPSDRKVTCDDHVMRHLRNHPEGVENLKLLAWIGSLRKTVFSFWDAQEALKRLQDQGLIACANKIWYRREHRPTAPEPRG